jgi:hypothetical protein
MGQQGPNRIALIKTDPAYLKGWNLKEEWAKVD